MRGISKKYNPPERTCVRCGTKFITRTPTQYRFRKRDRCKTSPTYNQLIYFCSDSCMTAFEKDYPVKQYRRLT